MRATQTHQPISLWVGERIQRETALRGVSLCSGVLETSEFLCCSSFQEERLCVRFLKERHFCLSNLLDVYVPVIRFYIVVVYYHFLAKVPMMNNAVN